MGKSQDWGTGLPLRSNLLGNMSRLEVHHIFPKAQLYKHGLGRAEVNALANFCFLTKDTNLSISDKLPENYFPKIESSHPGALASQWVPMDPELWKIDRYRDFLEARKLLLAEEANRQFANLLHGETQWLGASAYPLTVTVQVGGITSEAEELELEQLNEWVAEHSLPHGIVSFDYADSESGEPRAVFDLAWPDGLQSGLTQPVAVLINEGADVMSLANAAGFRCFTTAAAFKNYVKTEIIGTAME